MYVVVSSPNGRTESQLNDNTSFQYVAMFIYLGTVSKLHSRWNQDEIKIRECLLPFCSETLPAGLPS